MQNPNIPGTPNEEGSARYLLQRIADATQRLSQVFDEIRNVSLIDTGRLNLARDPITLKVLIQSVVHNLRSLGPPRDLQIEHDGLENLPAIIGDSRRLHQAIWNVVSNAIKCTPDGGRIRITGRLIEDTVHISVQDTGVGIPPDERERIFTRFYVLEDTIRHHSSKTAFKGGGMGLGLAVARGIIEAHGGKIWAESDGYDQERLPGSTFHILLPLHPPALP
jgi:signal transduction histidine kinase